MRIVRLRPALGELGRIDAASATWIVRVGRIDAASATRIIRVGRIDAAPATWIVRGVSTLLDVMRVTRV